MESKQNRELKEVNRRKKNIRTLLKNLVIKQKRLCTSQIHIIFSDTCSVKEIPIYLDVQIQGVNTPNDCAKMRE